MGRLRVNIPLKFPLSFNFSTQKNIAIIGAGQFSFATIGYFIKKNRGKSFVGVYDINDYSSNSFVKYYGGKAYDNVDELINNDKVKYVYIASNHASHTDYAIKALNADKVVYVEKPISVNPEQFERLLKAAQGKKMYVGYNRPLSPGIFEITKYFDLGIKRKPLTLSCFITGHKLAVDHWYRNSEEGTRVCGNIGHWLDLSINLLFKIGLPNEIEISIISSNQNEKDDNVSIVMKTDKEDLISIVLSSREEPFEGINETINIQHSSMIAKIDDFRRLTIWNGDVLKKKRYFRKNVGHENAILQPFTNKYERNFKEVEISTRLMLSITNAVKENIQNFIFIISK